jgi:hypothetical protein
MERRCKVIICHEKMAMTSKSQERVRTGGWWQVKVLLGIAFNNQREFENLFLISYKLTLFRNI